MQCVKYEKLQRLLIGFVTIESVEIWNYYYGLHYLLERSVLCEYEVLWTMKYESPSGGARILEQAGPAAGPKVLW